MMKYKNTFVEKGLKETLNQLLLVISGTGVKKDINKGFQYLEKAADNKNVCAMFLYDFLLLKGKFIKADEEEGSKYLKMAADTENMFTTFIYDFLVDSGFLINRNTTETLHYYKISADKGFNSAMLFYGCLLIENDDDVSIKDGVKYIYFFKTEYKDLHLDFNILYKIITKYFIPIIIHINEEEIKKNQFHVERCTS